MFDRLFSNPLSTGIQKLDALNRKFRATKLTLRSLGDDEEEGDRLSIQFAKPLDMGVVASIYDAQLRSVAKPKFLYFQPNHFIGDGDHIERVHNVDGSISYVFSIGSGDCQAGCIHRDFYRYNLFPRAKDYKVEKVPEDPDAGSREVATPKAKQKREPRPMLQR